MTLTPSHTASYPLACACVRLGYTGMFSWQQMWNGQGSPDEKNGYLTPQPRLLLRTLPALPCCCLAAHRKPARTQRTGHQPVCHFNGVFVVEVTAVRYFYALKGSGHRAVRGSAGGSAHTGSGLLCKPMCVNGPVVVRRGYSLAHRLLHQPAGYQGKQLRADAPRSLQARLARADARDGLRLLPRRVRVRARVCVFVCVFVCVLSS
jgi:hypothetical protein